MAGLWSWLFGGKKEEATKNPPPGPPRVLRPRATYDSAGNSHETKDWWSQADALSPARANSSAVRRVLRQRARHEVANNSYAKGIVLTLVNDVIGTGPRLQLRTPGYDDGNQRVESVFMSWFAEACLPEKLRSAKAAKTVDGEPLLLFTTNRGLSGPVKLDVRPLECDYLSDPTQGITGQANSNLYDGIEYDADGNPAYYHVAREHPGDGLWMGLKYDRHPASQVIHWFRADRPGQLRGVPEITPALHLFAQLRRYTLAVIAAAETAADFAAVLQSDGPVGVENQEPLSADPFEALDIERGMMTTMPAGWQMKQFQAEQPTTTYAMFKAEILNEIARCLNMPFNVAACNSSSYNYASGRLDHQVYHKSVKVEQHHCESVVLRRIFMAWLDEAALIPGLIPAGMPPFAQWQYSWLWPGYPHVDPLKEASAQALRLANRTTTYAAEFGSAGKDWEAEFRQLKKEHDLLAELGLAAPAASVTTQQGVQYAMQQATQGEEADA